MCWRRLSTRGGRQLPLVYAAACAAARRAAARWTAARLGSCAPAATCWRHLSTRGSRLSPLVSVAACTAARLGSFALAPPLSSGPPLEASVRRLSFASPPVQAGQRRGCLGSCALAPLSTRGLHPPPHVSSPPGQRSGEAAVRGAARELCADAAFGSRPPSVASRLIAVWTTA